jgi:hypothetical protein
MASDDTASKYLQWSRKIFPEIFAADGLVKKIEELREERLKLTTKVLYIFTSPLHLTSSYC